MDYKHKSHGIPYFKNQYSRALKQPKTKFISVPMEQAKDIMDEIDRVSLGEDPWSLKSNSLKAGALCLGLNPKELRERLVHPKPSQLLMDLCEARNKIKALESIGDKMFDALQFRDQERLAGEWVKTKKIFRE